MSGHSKWNNIKRTKGLQDAKRGALFSRLAKEILLATQLGGTGDINFNPYLRVAVNKAKAANMTSDKIQKAVNSGLGKHSSDGFSEKTYEISGFGGAIFLIDCETDSPNRTLTELKTIVGKEGAKFVPEGSLSWQFEEVGRIILSTSALQSDLDNQLYNVMSINGVVDVDSDPEENTITIFTKKEMLKQVLDEVKATLPNIEFNEAGLIKQAKDKVELDDKILDQNFTLVEKIKSHSDVVYVWDNIK